jgi:AraC-like DNA-binding protein
MNIAVPGPPAPMPLHRFPLVDTRDPNLFRDTVVSVFGARGFDFAAPPENFHAARCHLQLNSLDLIFGSCSAAYQLQFPECDRVKQHFVLQHSGRTRFGGKEFELSAKESAVIPAGTTMTHEYQAGFEQYIFRVEASALQAKLGAIVGMPVARVIEFVTPTRFITPSFQRLQRMLGFMVTELDHPDGQVSPVALAEFEQLLIVSFLNANRHNFSDLMDREQPRPAPWQVRLVEEYIEAHWNQPISIEMLAAAAGASMRSVFKAFRDARDCSPMMFVKSVRLGHARRLLQKADHTTSVVSVAFACGFLNPGHFARDYRLAFGELPSATLAAARRRRH